MQVTSASTRMSFEIGGVTEVRVSSAHRLYFDTRRLPISTDCCLGGAYKLQLLGQSSSFVMFMPVIVYSFAQEDDRCMWIRTITLCVCSSLCCCRHDHLEYFSFVFSGWRLWFGHLAVSCTMAACFAISPRYTFSFGQPRVRRICRDFPIRPYDLLPGSLCTDCRCAVPTPLTLPRLCDLRAFDFIASQSISSCR